MDQALIIHDPLPARPTREDLLSSCWQDFQHSHCPEETWAELCDALDQWDMDQEPRQMARHVALLEQHLAVTPGHTDAIRQAPRHWLERAALGLPHISLRLVRSLRLEAEHWSQAQLATLLAHPDLCRVRHLRVSGELGEAVSALVGSPMLPELRSVYLEESGVMAAQLGEVMSLGALPNLEALGLWGNPLGAALVGLLQASGTLRTLKRLDLGATGLGDQDVLALLGCTLPGLEALSMGGNRGITDHGADALIEALPVHLNQIYLVDLEGCSVSDRRLNQITRGLLPRF